MEISQVDDQMSLSSHLCIYQTKTKKAPDGVKKTRQRRRKGHGEGECVEKKRRLTVEQVNFLELNFATEPMLESARKDRLAAELGLDPRQVAVWFQNRRASCKSKGIRDEYMKLKTVHEGVLVHKCQLESEIMKLKEQLSKCEKEIKNLSEQPGCISGVDTNCSPSFSSSMDANDQPFISQFGAEENDNWPYIAENIYINGMEWFDHYAW